MRGRTMRAVLLLVAALFAGAAPLRADVTPVDSAALERLIGRGVPVIDIRTPEEWRETGVIEGSHLLTFFDARGRYDVRAWLSGLAAIASRDEPFALICDSGGRSALVSRFSTRSSATGTSSTFPEGSRNGRRRAGRPSVPASRRRHRPPGDGAGSIVSGGPERVAGAAWARECRRGGDRGALRGVRGARGRACPDRIPPRTREDQRPRRWPGGARVTSATPAASSEIAANTARPLA